MGGANNRVIRSMASPRAARHDPHFIAAPTVIRGQRALRSAEAAGRPFASLLGTLPCMPTPSIDEAGRRPVIAGTRIKVSHVAYESTVLAWSEAEIQAAHPHLTLAQIKVAIEYAVQNPARIRAEWEESRRQIEEAKRRFPPHRGRTPA